MPTRLAEIVIDAGLATRDQVMQAVAEAEAESVPLVVTLVRGGVDELALVSAVKRRVRVAITDPAVAKPDPEALRELSRDVCRRLRVLPLAVSVFDADSRVLQLAMADPTDAVTRAEVEHITGCQLEPSLMPLSAIEESVDLAYRAFVTEVMPRDRKAAGAGRGATAEPRASRRGAADPGRTSGASTVPYHRVADEAGLELRHRALVELLVDKQLITQDEYEAQIRQLMKRRSGEA